jgi:hypothetical protein
MRAKAPISTKPELGGHKASFPRAHEAHLTLQNFKTITSTAYKFIYETGTHWA